MPEDGDPQMNRASSRAAAALLAVSALCLSSCSAGSSGEEPAESAERSAITVALTGEPTNLDFTTTAGAAIPQALMTNVYEGLVEIDQDGNIQPLLAQSWDISEDRRTYTFTLQPDVTFSNGEPFTAEDVKFSLDRVTSGAWVSSLKNKMAIVEAVNVLSDTEVEIVLSRPSNAWLFDLGTPVGAMFDESGVDDLANTAIGTGPFTIEAWNRGQSIEMKARDDYWGEAPQVEAATLRYFADATATTNALRSGDVDVVYNMQAPELLSTFESDDAYQVLDGTSNGEIILSMNNKRAPFDDVRVRQAVMHAIDRQAVLDTAWSGYGTVVGAAVPPTDPYYEDLTGINAYDPDKARELLAEAGAEDLNITFSIPTHYIGPAGEDSQFCKKCKIIPLYVIVRNYITGTTADLLGLEYGFKPKNVVYELRYDNVGLNKPLINDHHAVALKIVTYQELETIYDIVGRANKVLVNIFHKAGIKLVDYRVKLGYAPDGTIILADEISPDTSRLWDEATGECLDKDRFRHDLGCICDNYRIVLDRITKVLEERK